MTAVAEKLAARPLAERVVEGRPASRTRSALAAVTVGAGVAVLVYKFLRSGDGDEEERFSSAADG